MKASETYRLMADMAERNNEDFTSNLLASTIAHLACDKGLSRERCIEVFTQLYDLLEPGFQATIAAATNMKPADYKNLDRLEELSNVGLGAILTAIRKGPTS